MKVVLVTVLHVTARYSTGNLLGRGGERQGKITGWLRDVLLAVAVAHGSAVELQELAKVNISLTHVEEHGFCVHCEPCNRCVRARRRAKAWLLSIIKILVCTRACNALHGHW